MLSDISKQLDLISQKKCIGCKVEIATVDGNNHNGHIYIVDPESKAVVIAQSHNELTLLPISTVKNISVNFDEKLENIADNIEKPAECSSDINKKKLKLKAWLEANQIDITEDGSSLKLQNHLVIEPPYDLEHCYCTNTIILDRIRKIISKMPL